MKKPSFLVIAAGLGVTVPACLIGIAEKCQGSTTFTKPTVEQIINFAKQESNPIQDKFLSLYSDEEGTPSQQIAHSNVHANYTISHTNVHTDYSVGKRYTDSHSDTPSKHVDSHSNSHV